MENEFDLEPPWPGMHNILVQRFGAAAFIADGGHPMIYAENDPPARLQPIRMPSLGNIHIPILLDRYLQRLCTSHLQTLPGLVMQ